MDADSILRDSNGSTIPSNILSDDDEGSLTSINSERSGHALLTSDSDGPRRISGASYVGFIVDANVTSYLMMGSLSPGYIPFVTNFLLLGRELFNVIDW